MQSTDYKLKSLPLSPYTLHKVSPQYTMIGNSEPLIAILVYNSKPNAQNLVKYLMTDVIAKILEINNIAVIACCRCCVIQTIRQKLTNVQLVFNLLDIDLSDLIPQGDHQYNADDFDLNSFSSYITVAMLHNHQMHINDNDIPNMKRMLVYLNYMDPNNDCVTNGMLFINRIIYYNSVIQKFKHKFIVSHAVGDFNYLITECLNYLNSNNGTILYDYILCDVQCRVDDVEMYSPTDQCWLDFSFMLKYKRIHFVDIVKYCSTVTLESLVP